ncbi:hypothetical protein [Burkholderia gladioli]|uniref:hypothetical protein n=1 Tax=Burkholderia gladioli TaxID=28095 RepID=UPI001640431A|nr:hypothetical protein [Burkholderia gladioli]
MTVNTGALLLAQHSLIRALGDKAIASDAMLVIDGYENIRLLCKQFPWPILTTGGEIEIPAPLGTVMYQPQQIKIAQQGAIEFEETRNGAIQSLFESLIATGGRFDAIVYEGTLEVHKRALPIYSAFVEMEVGTRDWENKSTPLNLGGTLFYHYYGENLGSNDNS